MDLNTIKKNLYQQNPTASLVNITIDGIRYNTTIVTPSLEVKTIDFLVPFSEVKDVQFNATEPAKYLIRWIIN